MAKDQMRANNAVVDLKCGPTDESSCQWSPWEGLLKVSQELRYSEKGILGGRLPRALQQCGALYFTPAVRTIHNAKYIPIIKSIHYGLSILEMTLIDWDNLRAALERQRLRTKVRLVKFMHNWLNMGHQKQKCNEDVVGDCPICHATKETWTHLFQCSNDDSIAIHALAIRKFWSKLIKLNTAPIMKQVLCYKIGQWCEMPMSPAPRIAEDEIGEVMRRAIEDQHVIGWDNMVKGKISINWKVITGIWSIFRQVWNTRNAHLHMEMQIELIANINQQYAATGEIKVHKRIQCIVGQSQRQQESKFNKRDRVLDNQVNSVDDTGYIPG
eukprot:15364735-Ditylum_brightwellii.AAC.1